MKKIIKKIFFNLITLIPCAILKIRQGIPFEKGKIIFKFYMSAALFRKNIKMAIKVFLLLFFKLSWKNYTPDSSLFNTKKLKPKAKVWQIGKWYSINPETESNAQATLDTPNLKYFSIGRESIGHILKCHTFDKKIVLLPNFTCFTVLDPFIQDGWEMHFYKFNKDLTVDTEYFTNIFKKTKPTLCVFQPFSGMGFTTKENALVEFSHKNGCITVLDQTQDIYNSRNNPYVDYYCGSLRKWYHFPDGAFLYSQKHNINNCENLEENDIYRTSMGLYMLMGHLNTIYDNPFFKYLYNFMWTFSVSYIGCVDIKTHTMSDYSRKVLSIQDEALNSKARIDNFKYIFEGIKGLKTVKPAFVNIERLTATPLSFPVYVKDRRDFSIYLRKNGINTQLLWGKAPYIQNHLKLDETTEYIYAHILSLPCDHRYTLDDMKKLVDIICAYEQDKQ